MNGNDENIILNNQEEKLSEKEFEERYCKLCGTQRCEGIGSIFFEGCVYKNKLKYHVDEIVIIRKDD